MNRVTSLPFKLLGVVVVMSLAFAVSLALEYSLVVRPVLRHMDDESARHDAELVLTAVESEIRRLADQADGIARLTAPTDAESMTAAMDLDYLWMPGRGEPPDIPADALTGAFVSPGPSDIIIFAAAPGVVAGRRLDRLSTGYADRLEWTLKDGFDDGDAGGISVRRDDRSMVVRGDLPLAGSRNTLTLSLRRDTVLEETGLRQILRLTLVFVGFLVVLAVVVLVWTFRAITHPLEILIAGIESWDGIRFPDFGRVTDRSDEVGILARTFRKMAGDIHSKTRSLEEMSVRDGLTGLYNRRRFDESLEDEIRRHRREAKPLSLIMADIDHFKDYNDRYGHLEGDECIRLVARSCGRGVRRPGDRPFRYGGEEFALILPGTDGSGARTIAETIRETVEDLGLRHEASPVADHVTVSMGVATTGADDDTTVNELVKRADDALYTAKQAGRNRVVGPGLST